MSLKVNTSYEVNIYEKVNNAEELYQSSISNQKIVKNIAFLALGFAGIGATTVATMLLGKGVANIVPNITNIVPILVGTVGIGGMSSVMALTTASFMGDSVVHAESEVKKAYANITNEQKNELLNNRKNFCKTIVNLREKHLESNNSFQNKLSN